MSQAVPLCALEVSTFVSDHGSRLCKIQFVFQKELGVEPMRTWTSAWRNWHGNRGQHSPRAGAFPTKPTKSMDTTIIKLTLYWHENQNFRRLKKLICKAYMDLIQKKVSRNIPKNYLGNQLDIGQSILLGITKIWIHILHDTNYMIMVCNQNCIPQR